MSEVQVNQKLTFFPKISTTAPLYNLRTLTSGTAVHTQIVHDARSTSKTKKNFFQEISTTRLLYILHTFKPRTPPKASLPETPTPDHGANLRTYSIKIPTAS